MCPAPKHILPFFKLTTESKSIIFTQALMPSKAGTCGYDDIQIPLASNPTPKKVASKSAGTRTLRACYDCRSTIFLSRTETLIRKFHICLLDEIQKELADFKGKHNALFWTISMKRGRVQQGCNGKGQKSDVLKCEMGNFEVEENHVSTRFHAGTQG